jgi:hypothetical protein
MVWGHQFTANSALAKVVLQCLDDHAFGQLVYFSTSALDAVLIVYIREAVYRHRGILLENPRFEFLLAAMLKIQVSPYAFMAR